DVVIAHRDGRGIERVHLRTSACGTPPERDEFAVQRQDAGVRRTAGFVDVQRRRVERRRLLRIGNVDMARREVWKITELAPAAFAHETAQLAMVVGEVLER